MAEEQLDKPGPFEPIEIALGDDFFVKVDIQYCRAVVRLYRRSGPRKYGVILTRDRWNLLKEASEKIDSALKTGASWRSK